MQSMTVGDLVRDAQAPTPATRAQIAAKLATLERLLSPLFDSLISVAAGIQECRALLAVDDDAHDDAHAAPTAPSEENVADGN